VPARGHENHAQNETAQEDQPERDPEAPVLGARFLPP
jgi:hypothetical protein